MTTLLIAITLISHVGVPPVLIAWLWVRRPSSRTDAAFGALAALLFLGLVSVGGTAWTWCSVYLRWVFGAAAIVASLRSIVRARTPGGPSAPPLGRTTRALGAASALFGVTLLLMMLAWRCPPGAVALHFPLGSGTFAIHQGGSSFALNGHALVKAQAFAVDIVKINALGMRARGFILSDPEAFGIYGEPVYAPCDGEVLALVETATAPSAPQASRHAVGRRYVVLYCEGVSVLFANLGAGSAPLEQGARVTVGDLIGHVGQTGDGSEPHLHVHAVRGRQPDLRRITAGAEPVPIRFDGRFLVRNDRVTIPPRDP